jgi:site-specific DNA-methyltransferase (adenine-specific)
VRLNHRIINANNLQWLRDNRDEKFDCIFADPFDNLGLKYDTYKDKIPDTEYTALLHLWLYEFARHAPVVWFSFYTKWQLSFGRIAEEFLDLNPDWEWKPCIQIFTFGQYNKNDFGNNHRPLWRFKHKDAPLYPEQTLVPSWRQLNGDKRAAEGGRVPGDVFDFTRVTGNSKQRRSWHPTQLNEHLYEQALLMTTKEGDHICDPFGGTGTLIRVCKGLNRQATVIEIDPGYCQKMREEHEGQTREAA